MGEDGSPQPLWRRFHAESANPNDLLARLEVTAPPVDVEGMARSMGIEIHRVKRPGWSGAVRSSESGATIWLDEADSPVRQRFTIAHEIGHLMLDPLGCEFRDSSFAGNSGEIHANYYAADLLMPMWMLDAFASKNKYTLTDLARIFGVSEQAMDIRLGKWAGKWR